MTNQNKLKFEAEIGVAGEFKMQAVSAGVVVREVEFKNLITDLGMNRLATHGVRQLFGACHVGTGTTTPAVTDTSLASPLASHYTIAGSTSLSPVAPDYVARTQYVFTFDVGAVVGNLTEVGVGGATAGNLFSRALIQDASGNPVSFPVLAGEQLVVTYQIHMYPPVSDTTGTMKLNPGPSETSHSTVSRGLTVNNVNNWRIPVKAGDEIPMEWRGASSFITAGNGSLVPPDSASGLPSTITFNGTTKPYVSGSFATEQTLTSLPGDGAGTISVMSAAARCGVFQWSYSPGIVKTASETVVLGIRLSWARR